MNSKHSRLTPLSAAVLLAVGSFWALADVAPVLTLGETITVTGTTDAAPAACSGTGTGAVTCPNLRSAIERANGNGNEAANYDLVVLANGSVHTLGVARDAGAEAIDAANNAVGDLDIVTPMNIATADPSGARATIQGGTGFGDRLLHVNSTVKLDNLVITKGQGVYMNGGAIYAGDSGNTTVTSSVVTDNFASWDQVDGTGEVQGSGGGIYSKGPLSVSMSTLSRNTAKTLRGDGTAEGDKIGNGGAIYASQAASIVDSTVGGVEAGNVAINGGGIQMAGGNKLEILRSTFSHNEAVSGGAINVVSPSAQPFTITNSTISTNHVTDAGAGINTNSSVFILNSTIADNVKDSGNKGSGLNLVGGTASLKNTLLANNLGGSVSANCGMVGSGTLAVLTQGGNLSTDGTCNLTFTTDQQNVADARIGVLAMNDNTLNGTWTHALLDGSPAIDKAVNDGCPSSDQRGSVRPFDYVTIGTQVCDIGAYEAFIDRQDLAIASMVAVPERLVVNSNTTLSVKVENNADSSQAANVVLTTTLPSGVSFVSGPAGCSAGATTVTCSIGTLAANSSFDVDMVLSVASAGANVITSTVTTTSNDPFPTNNSYSTTVVGLTVADLNLSAGGVSFGAGGQGQVTFTVLNQGAGDAKNVVVTGAVPENVALAAISDPGVCAINGAAFSCTIPELLATASKAVTLTVSSGTVGTYNVTAQVTGDVIDGDSADNTATAVVSVTSSGGGGGGCAVASGDKPFDPVLPALAALGLIGLGLRRLRRG